MRISAVRATPVNIPFRAPVGADNPVRRRVGGGCDDRTMIASALYWVVRRFAELLIVRRRSDVVNAVDVVVLRLWVPETRWGAELAVGETIGG
jgi:hypothetical protein